MYTWRCHITRHLITLASNQYTGARIFSEVERKLSVKAPLPATSSIQFVCLNSVCDTIISSDGDETCFFTQKNLIRRFWSELKTSRIFSLERDEKVRKIGTWIDQHEYLNNHGRHFLFIAKSTERDIILFNYSVRYLSPVVSAVSCCRDTNKLSNSCRTLAALPWNFPNRIVKIDKK